MDECHTFGKCVYDLKINLGHSDLYFIVQWFVFFYFFALKKILVLLVKLNSGELHCPTTALIRVCDQVRHKLTYATEARKSLDISAIETRGIILSRQLITKVLIRRHGCAGWSAPLLFAYGKNRFSHDEAHIIWCSIKLWTMLKVYARNFDCAFYNYNGYIVILIYIRIHIKHTLVIYVHTVIYFIIFVVLDVLVKMSL